MKKILIVLLGFLHVLCASESSNANFAENDLGYYGEGVMFGGYPIVGEWSFEYGWLVSNPTTFNADGTIEVSGTHTIQYGVSEDGKFLQLFDGYTAEWFNIDGIGDYGCFYCGECMANDISTCSNVRVCKQNIENRTYGYVSTKKSVAIKVGGVPPLLSNIPNYGFTVGDIVDINLEAYATSTEDELIIVEINGTLPPDLVLDHRVYLSGNMWSVIKGNVTTTGIYPLKAIAVDRDGSSNPVNFTITVCSIGQVYNSQLGVCL
jgi:hypothetical protein